MKKNLKICVENSAADERLRLFDMNARERLIDAGMTPDEIHKKSARVSGAWRFSERERIVLSLPNSDLSAYRYLTFSLFAVNGAGGSFSLFFDSSEGGDASSGYEITLPISHDGWNDYRIELPFVRARRSPLGWDRIRSIDFDCVSGGQSNREDTVLYLDTLYVNRLLAAPLYETMAELKGAAVLAKGGEYAIVNRRRVSLSFDGAHVRPFEERGVLWIPMGAIATVMAHTAVADNKAHTLSFTYRRKKYAFEARIAMMQVDGVRQSIPFAPTERDGVLFFPAEFVRDFFRWRQIFTDPTGLIVLSNRKNIFDRTLDAGRIRQLVADLTFYRPTGEEIVADLHKKIKSPGRGRLLATYDELMSLRKLAKSDPALRARVDALKALCREAEEIEFPTDDEKALTDALNRAPKRLISLAMLYRVTGDKQYCEQTAILAEAIAALSDWRSDSMPTVAGVALGMSVAYDWCHHMWSEARKAVIERAVLRNALRPAALAYAGKGIMWDVGSAQSASINAGFLASALALADVYPETALKILRSVLRNLEPLMENFAPDGGYAEGMCAWEGAITGAALTVRMLETACDSDYGFASMPGFLAGAMLSTYAETANGAWNYGNCAARALDTSILSYFTQKTGDPVYAWLRQRELIAKKKAITPYDILFYTPVDDSATFELPLDAVYRRVGLAVMRADWSGEGMTLCLHGGRNNDREGDLDAGSFILECAGERFFAETGGNEAIPMLLRRRAEGQNTHVIDPTDEAIPDQNPAASAPVVEMRSSEERVYAIVDMRETNDKLVRARRGVMLTDDRQVAVIQDEAVLSEAGVAIWHAYTPAEVELNRSGRVARLTLNGKTLVCRLCGIGAPARFEAEKVGESGLTHLFVRVEGRDRLRMAVACHLATEDEGLGARRYEVVPMSRWGE